MSQYSSFAQLSMCPAHLSSSNSLSENPVDAFKTAIFHLRTQPGNLDDYMKPVADLLERKYVDTYLLNEIVEILFEEVSICFFLFFKGFMGKETLLSLK